MKKRQAVLKRGFDVIVAFAALVLAVPVILVCARMARRDTGLTGIYSQTRVGLHGRPFVIRKIRSMKPGPGEHLGTVTVDGDPRITRTGRFMRRFKLDELPQLWNVLVGDMSLVGPRPDVPGYADALVGSEREILSIRPGITGPATIKYRDEERLLKEQSNPRAFNDRVIYPDKVRLNLDYARHWSLRMDIRYLLVTAGLRAVPKELRFSRSVQGK